MPRPQKHNYKTVAEFIDSRIEEGVHVRDAGMPKYFEGMRKTYHLSREIWGPDLRRARESMGLSQAMFAAMVGDGEVICQSGLHSMEHGRPHRTPAWRWACIRMMLKASR